MAPSTSHTQPTRLRDPYEQAQPLRADEDVTPAAATADRVQTSEAIPHPNNKGKGKAKASANPWYTHAPILSRQTSPPLRQQLPRGPSLFSHRVMEVDPEEEAIAPPDGGMETVPNLTLRVHHHFPSQASPRMHASSSMGRSDHYDPAVSPQIAPADDGMASLPYYNQIASTDNGMESPLYHRQHLHKGENTGGFGGDEDIWGEQFEDTDRFSGMAENFRDQEERVAEEEIDDPQASHNDPGSQVGLFIHPPFGQCSFLAVRYTHGAYETYQRHQSNNKENDAIDFQGPSCIPTLHTSSAVRKVG